MRTLIAALAIILAPATALAADIEAGRDRAAACTACHGANGTAVSPDIPNLAGQNVKYLETQLKAFRSGTRKNALMNAMAASLEDTDIVNLVAFFNSLTPAKESQASAVGQALADIELAFPVDYNKTFKRYSVSDQAGPKRVRYNFSNAVGLSGLDAGGMLADGAYIITEVYSAKVDGSGNLAKGDDGHFIPDKMLFIAAMEKRAGSGAAIPESLRNAGWTYALFTPEGKHKTTPQAKCLACHKPLHDADYMFTYDEIKKANQ